MSEPNVELLRATMDAVLAHPDRHDQQVWASQTDCGTAYCFAGWACHLSGLQVDFTTDPHDAVYLTDGRDIESAAVNLLGLPWDQASDLFDPANSVADLKHHVDLICDRP